MFIKSLLSIIIFLSVFGTACSGNSQGGDEIVINDREVYAANSNEVIVSDNFDFSIDSSGLKTNRAGQTRTIRSDDNSEITVMVDNFGNKSEIRVFSNHPRLATVLVRTGIDGHKETFAYDQFGKVKPLPAVIVDRAMTAPADELANSAGIQTMRTEAPSFTQNTKPLQPLPSSQFPIRNQQIQQAPPPQAVEEPTEDSAKQPVVKDNNNESPTSKPESPIMQNK